MRLSGLALSLTLCTFPGSASELCLHTADCTIDVWQVEQGLPQISVTSIAQTPDGYLWLGSFDGLARFDGVRFMVFDEANTPALRSSAVVRLLPDPQGGLWILSQDGGLARMAEGRFTACDSECGLPTGVAAALVVDLNQRPWVVDQEGGLHRIEDGRLMTGGGPEPGLLVAPSEPCWVAKQGEAINSSQAPLRLPTAGAGGLSSEEITVRCATRRRAGGFWLAAASGVYRFEGGHLQGPALPFPRPIPDLVRVFNRSDGLSTVDCTGGGQPASCKSREGRPWFATIKGLASVDPAQLPLNAVPPPVVIEEVVLDARSVAERQGPAPGAWDSTAARRDRNPRAAVGRPLTTAPAPVFSVPPCNRHVTAAADRGGLGLRQVAEHARIMGGDLALQAQPVKGTRLTLDVPLPERC